jgi:hypothetical protein
VPLALGGGDEFLREGAHAPGATQDPANPLFAEFGYNELKGYLRAHPRTARRHHAELLESEAAPTA